MAAAAPALLNSRAISAQGVSAKRNAPENKLMRRLTPAADRPYLR